MGHQATVRYDVIPAGIFTLPEIGRVGVTEQQAKLCFARLAHKMPVRVRMIKRRLA